jgi:hypothetical protein
MLIGNWCRLFRYTKNWHVAYTGEGYGLTQASRQTALQMTAGLRKLNSSEYAASLAQMSQDPADKYVFLTRNREVMRGQVAFQFRRRHFLQLQMTTLEFREQSW